MLHRAWSTMLKLVAQFLHRKHMAIACNIISFAKRRCNSGTGIQYKRDNEWELWVKFDVIS